MWIEEAHTMVTFIFSGKIVALMRDVDVVKNEISTMIQLSAAEENMKMAKNK